MLRKVGLVSALLLALPAFANAWTVTAKIGSGLGKVEAAQPVTVADPDGVLTIEKLAAPAVSRYIGYYRAVNGTDADQTFTVDPAAGFSISSVIVNGVNVTGTVAADATATYTVAAGTPIKNSQSLVVYFKQNLLSVDVVQDLPKGKVTVQRCNAAGTAVYGSASLTGLTGLKAGSFVKVTAMPNSDYKVVSVNGDTDAAGLQGDVVSKVVAVTVDGQDVTAAFDLVSIVKPAVAISKNIALPNEVLTLDATKTVANKAIAKYTFSATLASGAAATGALFNPAYTTRVSSGRTYYDLIPYVADANGRPTVKFTAEGDYVINVEVELADGTKYDSAVDARVKVAQANSCMTCHNNRNAALMASVQSGKHNYTLVTGHSSAGCQRCHTTEGYNAYAGTTDADFATGATTFTAVADMDAQYNIGLTNVGCFACHNNHDSVLRDTPAQWDPKYSATGASATQQFKLCTSCHGLVNNDGAPIASGLEVSGVTTAAMQKHNTDWYRNIASTHYDLPTTGVGLTTTYIEGYNIRYNKESACTDCHGHDFLTETGDAEVEADTVYTQWAKSGHAGGLLKQKFAKYVELGRAKTAASNAAIMAAGVTADTGIAWEHYNWDDSTKLINSNSKTDRQACQKCHTSTGVANYLDAANTFNKGGAEKVFYDAANNDFSHLLGWNSTTKSSTQNEMLYCWGCHNNAGTGALRVDGAMTLDYKAATDDTANIVLAAPVRNGVVNGKSAACVSCHAGRGNVVSLMGTTASDPGRTLNFTTTPATTATATSTHYLNAAATIFKDATKVGYEFAGGSYSNPSYYKHNQLGCADCHMPNKAHSFEVVEKDATGAVTALLGTSCVGCHATWTDGALAVSVIEEEAEGYKQALELFNAALIAKGYIWTPNHPYFMLDYNEDGVINDSDKLFKLTTKNAAGKVTNVTYSATLPEGATEAQGWTLTAALVGPLWPNEGDLGAAHNYNYLLHEPGAYAHNRKYAKRLIWDSIDWLDNGVMNGSIVIPAELTHAAAWLGTARP